MQTFAILWPAIALAALSFVVMVWVAVARTGHMNDPFVGTLTFARIYSGKLEAASQVVNSVKDKKEKVGRMLLMHANSREDITEAYAGDIVALAGLKDTTTGDTLCAGDKPIILERMDSIAIDGGKTKALKGNLEKIGFGKTALVIDGDAVENTFALAAGNLREINVLPAAGANVYDILKHGETEFREQE